MSNTSRNRDQEERCYSPPPMRKYNPRAESGQEPKQVKQPNEGQSNSFVNSSSPRNGVMSNLDRFMKNTTPIVTAQYFPKTSVRGWRDDESYQPYFVLGDLWESYAEWSAYGAGVPLVLNKSDYGVQYYTPYLSGIQLYVDPLAPVMTVRRPGEQSDSDSSRDAGSDGSYEAGAVCHETYVPENNFDSIAQNYNKLVLSEGEIRDPDGLLAFEYFERTLPFDRAPLADQAMALADKFPVLRNYRSCDLTPSSWFSVAWYPIYRIPAGPSFQRLDSCFLTFHSLSTPLRGIHGSMHDGGMPCQLSLPIFGFAVYKLRSCDWTLDSVHGIEKVNSLIHCTENWLRRLRVNHPDFMHFRKHSFLW